MNEKMECRPATDAGLEILAEWNHQLIPQDYCLTLEMQPGNQAVESGAED